MVQGPESCGADPPVQTRLPVAGSLVHHPAARPPQHRPRHHWPETASVTRRPALRAPPPTGGKNLRRQAELRRWERGGREGGGRRISSPRQGEGAPLCALLLYLAGIRRGSRGQTPRVVRLQGPHNPLCTQPLKAKDTEEVGHTQGFLSWAGDSCLGR